ncbi:MAG TPA: XTP/dITP diphosphatase [Pyrinomonadaceae bacterium]|jgi:XTP/dITP diphosphohydrolase
MNKNALNRFQLLIATGNIGKIAELKNSLADLPIELKSLSDFPFAREVEENGKTFAQNAALKARGYARQTGLRALADDSGLEVAALNGAPGVFSARYAGEKAADRENVEKLLRAINETGSSNRAARFVCAMAIASDAGDIEFTAEGFCDGTIIGEPRGANGFGYDPIFIPDEFTETFAELPTSVKLKISHRGRAAAKIIKYLRDFIAV